MSDDAICPCQGDDPDPGPHLASCPWSDPDYDGGFAEDMAFACARVAFLQRCLGEYPPDEPADDGEHLAWIAAGEPEDA